MEFLKKIKNTPPISPNFTSNIIHCLQIQLLAKFLYSQSIPLICHLLKVQSIIQPDFIQGIVLFNFLLNLLIFGYFFLKIALGLRFLQKYDNLTSKLLEVLKFMPYLTFVQIFNYNGLSLLHSQSGFNFLGFLNMVFALIHITVINLANVSYKFNDQNYVKRKKNNIFSWIFIIAIVISSNHLQTSQTCLLLCMRSFYQLYVNFYSLENEIIRKLQYFYPFLTFSISFLYLAKTLLNFSIFQNVLHFAFTLILMIYSSMSLAENTLIRSLRYHLSKNDHLFQFQANEQQSQILTRLQHQIDENQLSMFLLFIRILANVYIARQRYQNPSFSSQLVEMQVINNYDLCWPIFNGCILKHKVECNQVSCDCRKLKSRESTNEKIVKQIFLRTISKLLKMPLAESNEKNNKLRIVEKYFMIEFQNKPLKAFYESVKLFHQKLSFQEKLQVEQLIRQTRTKFQQVFVTQKFQNQSLEISPVLQFEEKMEQTKSALNQITHNYKKFYGVLSKCWVDMDSLKASTKTLTQLKSCLNIELENHLQKYGKKFEFLTLCLIYYNYFDDYSGKMNEIHQKVQNLMIRLSNSWIKVKTKLDVFDPIYGAIRIDLIFNPGVIISITKNMSELLNFNINELKGQSVNKIMPLNFSRYHGKFLRNFVEKGSFKMLKLKQRTFYAKNANNFIVPITARLKIDYLSNDSFSACSLINKLQTKSEFIMLNNHGKIQEISENIYKILFKQAFKEEIIKIKKLSLYKMLLSLNFLLKQTTEAQSRVYEGNLLTCESAQNMQRMFQLQEFNRYLEDSEDTSVGNTQLSDFTSKKTSQLFNTLTKSNFNDSIQNENSFTHSREAFRDFTKRLNLSEVKAYRVSFKFYEIVTSEFKCKMVEILSFRQQLTNSMIQQQVPQQIVDLGVFYGISNPYIETYKQLTQNTGKTLSNSLSSASNTHSDQNQHSKKSIVKTRQQNLIINDVEQTDSVQNFVMSTKINTFNEFKNSMIEPGSQGSSYFGGNQEGRLKDKVIQAFKKKDFIEYKTQIFINVLILLLSITLGLVCVFSIRLQSDYQQIQHDNLIVENLRINFEFRLAYQQIEHFYHYFNLTPPAFLPLKKQQIIEDLKDLLINSISWINDEISNELYLTEIQYYDEPNNLTYTRKMLSTMSKIYNVFLMSESQGEYLSHNYVRINNYLQDIDNKEKQLVLKTSRNFSIKVHIIVAIYVALLICLGIVFAKANLDSLNKQSKVIDFLTFINSKQIAKKLCFFEMFHDHINQKEKMSLLKVQQFAQDDHLVAISNKLRMKESRGGKNNGISDGLFLMGRQNGSTHSGLLKVVKSSKKICTVKNGILIVGALCVCVSVVLCSQMFYGYAHSKFQTFIVLKDAAIVLETIPVRLILLYFSNFDDILRGEHSIEYPHQFYVMAHDEGYKTRISLSSLQHEGSEMANLIDRHITSGVCELTGCTDNSLSSVTREIQYLASRFQNAFQYVRQIKQKLPDQNDAKDQLKKWIEQNKIVDLLQTTNSLQDLVKLGEKQITKLFDLQVNRIGEMLFYISLTVIPLLIVFVEIVRKKFIALISSRLEVTQNVFKHFSWSMLSANTYALNYFQQKVKQTKSI